LTLSHLQASKETYELLNDDDIEGQEDDTIAQDGEIQITPFNLKEEQASLFGKV
jgi:hypothetical protein